MIQSREIRNDYYCGAAIGKSPCEALSNKTKNDWGNCSHSRVRWYGWRHLMDCSFSSLRLGLKRSGCCDLSRFRSDISGPLVADLRSCNEQRHNHTGHVRNHIRVNLGLIDRNPGSTSSKEGSPIWNTVPVEVIGKVIDVVRDNVPSRMSLCRLI